MSKDREISRYVTRNVLDINGEFTPVYINANFHTRSYRTRKLKRFVTETTIYLTASTRDTNRKIVTIHINNMDLRELVRCLDMIERQERIDQGELNETDLQIPG